MHPRSLPLFLVFLVAGCAGSRTTAPEPEPTAEPAARSPVAESPAVDPALLDERLELAPAVRTGTLDNGLRYYVRRNTEPEDRAELRLVIDAGSVLEDEDQRGLAHFVEHMAFNGTARFEKQA
ncbi:MAG: insulinase family protein, partial [Rhodothermales bacterium]|nr:insulinase family protein [Rhodothermales bacterium]